MLGIPNVKVHQVWNGKDLNLIVNFSFEEDERIYRETHTIVMAKDLDSESEIAFHLSRMFKDIYENICIDNLP